MGSHQHQIFSRWENSTSNAWLRSSKTVSCLRKTARLTFCRASWPKWHSSLIWKRTRRSTTWKARIRRCRFSCSNRAKAYSKVKMLGKAESPTWLESCKRFRIHWKKVSKSASSLKANSNRSCSSSILPMKIWRSGWTSRPKQHLKILMYRQTMRIKSNNWECYWKRSRSRKMRKNRK